jgi:hypothetical protein
MTPADQYRRISRIVIAVCTLNGEGRTKALDRLCVRCPELRGEVELLLKFHDRAARAAGRGTRYLPS